jgi:hypothetical protein
MEIYQELQSLHLYPTAHLEPYAESKDYRAQTIALVEVFHIELPLLLQHQTVL